MMIPFCLRWTELDQVAVFRRRRQALRLFPFETGHAAEEKNPRKDGGSPGLQAGVSLVFLMRRS